MNKWVLLLPALLPLLPEAAAAPTPRTAAYVEAAMANQKLWLAAIRDATALLEGMKDTAGADAAVPALQALRERMRQLQKDSAGFVPPSAAEEAAFKAAMNTAEVKKTVNAFLAAMETVIQADCYHSPALLEELPKLMSLEQ